MVDTTGVLQSQEQFAADNARASGRAAGGGAPSWLASHPTNERRLNDIRAIAGGCASSRGRLGRRQPRALPAGGRRHGLRKSAAQGFTRGRQFVHPDLGLALTAPDGWRIRNCAEAITLVNAAGDAGEVVRLVRRGRVPAPTCGEALLVRSYGRRGNKFDDTNSKRPAWPRAVVDDAQF